MAASLGGASFNLSLTAEHSGTTPVRLAVAPGPSAVRSLLEDQEDVTTVDPWGVAVGSGGGEVMAFL